MRFVRRVLIFFVAVAASSATSGVHAQDIDLFPITESTSENDTDLDSDGMTSLDSDIDLSTLPRIPIPEPHMIFGIGVMSLALGGGLLVRHKKTDAAKSKDGKPDSTKS